MAKISCILVKCNGSKCVRVCVCSATDPKVINSANTFVLTLSRGEVFFRGVYSTSHYLLCIDCLISWRTAWKYLEWDISLYHILVAEDPPVVNWASTQEHRLIISILEETYDASLFMIRFIFWCAEFDVVGVSPTFSLRWFLLFLFPQLVLSSEIFVPKQWVLFYKCALAIFKIYDRLLVYILVWVFTLLQNST